MKITDVRINGMKNPAGYSFDSVRVSWKVTDSEGIAQKDAEIEVSLDQGIQRTSLQKEQRRPEPDRRSSGDEDRATHQIFCQSESDR